MADGSLAESIPADARDRVYGKYRGIVMNNVDPLGLGRIQATVPEVLGEIPTGWATPCAPTGGFIAGLLSVPMVGTGVWIEFEAGDVSRPIWTGGYWGAGEVPVTPPNMTPPSQPGAPTTKIWRSDLGLSVALDDATQTITLSDVTGTFQIVLSVSTATVTVKSAGRVVIDSQVIQEGSQAAAHPSPLGDLLLGYLAQLVTIFNAHVHPGELAGGFLPVTPAPPVAPMPPPSPSLLSLKVFLE